MFSESRKDAGVVLAQETQERNKGGVYLSFDGAWTSRRRIATRRKGVSY